MRSNGERGAAPGQVRAPRRRYIYSVPRSSVTQSAYPSGADIPAAPSEERPGPPPRPPPPAPPSQKRFSGSLSFFTGPGRASWSPRRRPGPARPSCRCTPGGASGGAPSSPSRRSPSPSGRCLAPGPARPSWRPRSVARAREGRRGRKESDGGDVGRHSGSRAKGGRDAGGGGGGGRGAGAARGVWAACPTFSRKAIMSSCRMFWAQCQGVSPALLLAFTLAPSDNRSSAPSTHPA